MGVLFAILSTIVDYLLFPSPAFPDKLVAWLMSCLEGEATEPLALKLPFVQDQWFSVGPCISSSSFSNPWSFNIPSACLLVFCSEYTFSLFFWQSIPPFLFPYA